MRILVLVPMVIGFVSAWNYDQHGPDMWEDEYPTCAGDRQSPIDIPPSDSGHLQYEALGPITFSGYENIIGPMSLSNNGHTAVVSIPDDDQPNTYIQGGGLNGTYLALQFHFHWGPDASQGSEHTYRGKKYPLELHIVHYKQSYGTVAEALNHGDGLAVVGVFFELGDSDNTDLNAVINGLPSIRYKSQSTDVSMSLNDVLGTSNNEFYRYEGSLTTPGCNEVVIWTVLEGYNHISTTQLAKFRELKETLQSVPDDQTKPMVINYRLPQPLGDRIVTKTYEGATPSHYHWGYHGHEGPDSWKYYYPTCDGHRQSPINIPALYDDRIAAFDAYMMLDTLEFVNYDQILTGQISNNGHTVVVSIDSPDVLIHKGGLPGVYKAVQFHFHWGRDNEHGSEHTINGIAFPLELHIVHYKVAYGSVAEALKRDDGLAVIGFMYEVSGSDNDAYSSLLAAMTDVKFKGDSSPITGISLEGLTLANLKKNASTGVHYPYYRYEGSLTTPPCSQAVIWTVMNEPLQMSSSQLQKFRELTHVKTTSAALTESDYIIDNFRPPQNLVYRHVFLSSEGLVGQPGMSDSEDSSDSSEDSSDSSEDSSDSSEDSSDSDSSDCSEDSSDSSEDTSESSTVAP